RLTPTPAIATGATPLRPWTTALEPNAKEASEASASGARRSGASASVTRIAAGRDPAIGDVLLPAAGAEASEALAGSSMLGEPGLPPARSSSGLLASPSFGASSGAEGSNEMAM